MRLFRLAALAALAVATALAAGNLSNRRAPGFSLMDVNYNQHDLADYRGKVVLVEFIRTDCPVCQGFTTIIDKVKTRFGDQVEVLTIVATPPDSQQSVMNFINTYKVRNPVLFDCGQVAASYLRLNPQNPRVALPHFFVVDQRGTIRSNYEYGDATEAFFTGDATPLMNEIEALVNGPLAPAAKPQTGRPERD
ncbi:MAG: TlpA family protein disulfide reductase [Bryobacterales bacterium]|nr:TlpA family protein disulfide reductase [Bryobacterales bacterium]